MARISGVKFEAARKRVGMSRSDIAKVTHLTYTRIWQIGTDEVSNVGEFEFVVMCKEFCVKAEELQP